MVPVQIRMALQEAGDIPDPTQGLPHVLESVNGKGHQQVFAGEIKNAMLLKRSRFRPLPPVIQLKRKVDVFGRNVPVKLHQGSAVKFCERIMKIVFVYR